MDATLEELRRAALVVVSIALMVGCGAVGVTLAVDPITIPAQSTGGTICYAPGEVTSRTGITTASYRAQATYRSDALLTTDTSVSVRVYGRATAPTGGLLAASDAPPAGASAAAGASSATCVAARDGGDVLLGGPFTLELDEPREVVVGEGEAAADLADLVTGDAFWIGVALETGFTLGGESTITFDEGRVRVTF